jgi:hypothetical protein
MPLKDVFLQRPERRYIMFRCNVRALVLLFETEVRGSECLALNAFRSAFHSCRPKEQ